MEEILNILDKEKGNVSRLKKWKRKTLLSVTKPL